MKTKFDKDFEAWFRNNEEVKEFTMSYHTHMMGHGLIVCKYDTFLELPPTFQFGVYQDFGDSVGYRLLSFYDFNEGAFCVDINNEIQVINGVYDMYFKTRQEARQAAIDKFKELYNESE